MAGPIGMAPRHFSATGVRELTGIAVVVVALAVTAAITDAREWQPTTLVVALAIVMVLADVAVVWARKLRVSPGLMVRATIMALLGPAPAVLIGALSILLIDGLIYRVGLMKTLMNAMTVAVLGLTGGLMFEAIRTGLGIDAADAEYAALVLPTYVALAALNLAIILAAHPLFDRDERSRLFKESGLPTLPLELLNGMLAATSVFLWAQRGHVAAAGLLAVLIVLIPLTRSFVLGLESSDDLVTLREVSDARAAEVARLASDRERLQSEVMHAEERERARLAESLHDGPLQRLMALRQDAAESDSESLEIVQWARARDLGNTGNHLVVASRRGARNRLRGFHCQPRLLHFPCPRKHLSTSATCSMIGQSWRC